MKPKLVLLLILFTADLPLGRASTAQPHYAVVNLGNLAIEGSVARAINNHGEIVGVAEWPDGSHHGFFFANGVMHDLPTLGGTNSQVFDISDAGHMVGMADLPDGAHHAFLCTNALAADPLLDLETLGGSASAAYCINSDDDVAGGADDENGGHHAFLTGTEMGGMGGMMDLHPLDGSMSLALGMNDNGHVVGYASVADGVYHAFHSTPGGMGRMTVDLGTLGGPTSVAHAISDLGLIVGGAALADGTYHAFEARRGMMGSIIMTDLGTLGGTNSEAYCVNNLGQIVGGSAVSNQLHHAFLFDQGTLHDLNDLIPEGTGWHLMEAYGINDAGQIVGCGRIGDQTNAFLLTPVMGSAHVVSPPASQIMGEHDPVRLELVFETDEACTYQWMLDGRWLEGETALTLLLPHMDRAQAGHYQVLVYNEVGLVANPGASLGMFSVTRANRLTGLSMDGAPGTAYRFDYCDRLGRLTEWGELTHFSLTNRHHHFLDPASSDASMRFYRAVLVP